MLKYTILIVILSLGESVKASSDNRLRDFRSYYEETDYIKKLELLEGRLFERLDEREYDLFQVEVEEIIDYASKKEDSFLLNYARFLLGHVYIKAGKLGIAENFINNSTTYFLELNNLRLLGFLYRDKGIINEGLSKNNAALKYFKQSQRFFKDANLKTEYVHSRALEAKVLIHFKAFKKAQYILKGCIHHMINAKKYKTVYGYYNFLSDLYAELDNEKKVKYYNTKSAEYAVKSGDLSTIALSKNNLAIARFYDGDIEGALKYFQAALETRWKLKKTKLICESYYNIGTVYFETGLLDSAIVYFDKSLQLAKSNSLPIEIADAYLALSEVNEKSKNFFMALIMNKRYVKVKEEIYLTSLKDSKDQSLKLAKIDSDASKARRKNFDNQESKVYSTLTFICAILGFGYIILLGFFLLKKRKAAKVSLP